MRSIYHAIASIVAGTQNQGGPAASVSSVSVTFPAAHVFPQELFYMRRGWVGSSASRAWASIVQGGTRYVVSFRHQGSGADASAWETQLSGATHAYADLTSGARTGTELASAWASAMTGLGVTGVSAVGDTVTITGASSLLIGSPYTYDNSMRGLWGAQRWDWGTTLFQNQLGNMGGTGSVHVSTPGTGRILGAYIATAGTADVRLGVGDGPAYSTTPTDITNVVEGVSTNNSGLRMLLFAEPMSMSAASHKWVLFKGAGGGDPQLNYRAHGATGYEGRGDLGTSEYLVWDSTNGSDPAVAFATGGTYTPANDTSFGIYSMVGLIYELADGSGSYPGDAGLIGQIGYHGGYSDRAHQTTDPAIQVDEAVGFRFPLPAWSDGIITDATIGIEVWDSGEDVGVGFYDVPDLDYITTGTSARVGPATTPFLTTGVGDNTVTLGTPINFSDVSGYFATFINAGDRVGGITLTALSFNYDGDAGSARDWITRWEDNGREWCDFMPAGSGIGLGHLTEYRTLGAAGGDLLYGDPNGTWPATSSGAGGDGPRNLIRLRYGIAKPGITGA